MAPVTGRVPNREEDGLVLLLGPLQGFTSPGVPVHLLQKGDNAIYNGKHPPLENSDTII